MHTFCQHCINQWRANSERETRCPQCRAPITSEGRNLLIDNMINIMVDLFSEEKKKNREDLVRQRQDLSRNQPTPRAPAFQIFEDGRPVLIMECIRSHLFLFVPFILLKKCCAAISNVPVVIRITVDRTPPTETVSSTTTPNHVAMERQVLPVRSLVRPRTPIPSIQPRLPRDRPFGFSSDRGERIRAQLGAMNRHL